MSGELDPYARDHLSDVDRLGEVVSNPELETADFAFDRTIARQKHERYSRPGRVFSQSFHEIESVRVAELGIRQDQVRFVGLEDLECALDARAGSHVVACVAEAHLEHAEASLVSIDNEEILPGHYPTFGPHRVRTAPLWCLTCLGMFNVIN